ncbi:MAG TPA: uracil-DNA glycosylase [Nitrososphaeraceae archaeon]|nr:uracil-DNA glycosylase [Nitrososphaeraceae archaeon]
MIENSNSDLTFLNQRIVACNKCTRLAEYIKKVGITKVKRYDNIDYWSKPLSGFGDKNSELIIIGLAPAAHGGNRTGRMFTGDSSGNWLMKALYQYNFCNQPFSNDRNDGLVLNNVYVTSVVKCAPPKNKPLLIEINNCNEYLNKELNLLSKTSKVFLTLGKLAFDEFCKIKKIKQLKFKHGLIYHINNTNNVLISSYHPSRQNTNTGKLTWPMWINIFKLVRDILDKRI